METTNWKKEKVGVIMEALNTIKSSPETHGFSEDDVSELKKIEKELSFLFKKTETAVTKISNVFEEGFKALTILFDIQFKTFEEQLKNVVKLGWYISPAVFGNIPIGELNEITRNEKIVEFENYILKTFTDKKIEETIAKIAEEYPNRKAILQEIVDLHKTKKYFGSICLTYSQIDGICNDHFEIGFFDVDRKTKELKIPGKITLEEESVNKRISSQLNEPRNELTNHSKDYDKESKRQSFNRHLVMHGHSLSYGTNKNSVRAILLLEFIYWLIKNGSNERKN